MVVPYGQKVTRPRKKGKKKIQKKNLKDWTKWNRKWVVEVSTSQLVLSWTRF
jgi:hypothetical protein